VPDALDTAGVRRWADLGLAALGRHRSEIDALNVFPVPDGDTGTNMFLTFEAAVDALTEARSVREAAQTDIDAPDEPVHESVATLAHGALLGARGNSGIILSQIVHGFADGLATVQREAGSHHEAVVAAFTRAADSAYAAVADPREGTVLSVARAAADAVSGLGPGTSLGALLTTAADAATEALARTPDQLEVLRRAGVVDAGGRGLVVILDSLAEAVTGVRRDPGPAAPPVPLDVDAFDEGGGAYEVMYLLEAPDPAAHTLRAVLAELGDSVVVVGGNGLWNVHVHTDDVGAAIESGIVAGRPHRIRVTDLREDAARRRARPHGRGVVAVAHGAGSAALLETAGVTVVRATGRVAPSTAEMLEGITRSGVDEVLLLPSESDIRPVAEAAAEKARLEGVRVSVVPTRSIVQTLAAVAVHDSTATFDDDVVAMTRAAGETRYGGVSVAVREAVTSAGVCRVGDVLGIVGGDVVEIGDDVADVAARLLARLLSTGGELVTLVRGAEADDAVVDAVRRRVRRQEPGVEVQVYDGGQPYWPLIVGVE
jgi:DAK2 domain fusion protein YloV